MSNPREGEEAEAPPCDPIEPCSLSPDRVIPALLPPESLAPRGVSPTELVEPCGALPRKGHTCLEVGRYVNLPSGANIVTVLSGRGVTRVSGPDVSLIYLSNTHDLLNGHQ
jgi:hypothetical protein